MPRPPEAAPALIYKEGSDVIIDGDTYAPETDTPGLKVYRALLTQSGTDAPVATVLENTLGGTVVWTYTAGGVYTGTLASAFPANKTWTNLQNLAWDSNPGNSLVRGTSNTVVLNISAGDDFLVAGTEAFVEVLVYP